MEDDYNKAHMLKLMADHQRKQKAEFKTLIGFRFCPLDGEVIANYLMKKIMKEAVPYDLIKLVNVYEYNPADLCAMYEPLGDNQWYFFTPRDRKYANGSRPNRAAGDGFWKATGKDKEVYHNNVLVGYRKALVFYEGKSPRGVKTDWIMHEYTAIGILRQRLNSSDMRLDDCVCCRIYNKGVKEDEDNIDQQYNQEPEQPLPEQPLPVINNYQFPGVDVNRYQFPGPDVNRYQFPGPDSRFPNASCPPTNIASSSCNRIANMREPMNRYQFPGPDSRFSNVLCPTTNIASSSCNGMGNMREPTNIYQFPGPDYSRFPNALPPTNIASSSCNGMGNMGEPINRYQFPGPDSRFPNALPPMNFGSSSIYNVTYYPNNGHYEQQQSLPGAPVPFIPGGRSTSRSIYLEEDDNFQEYSALDHIDSSNPFQDIDLWINNKPYDDPLDSINYGNSPDDGASCKKQRKD